MSWEQESSQEPRVSLLIAGKNSELGVKRSGFKPRFCYHLNMKSSASCFYVNTGNPCFSLDSEELKPVNPKGNQP